MLNDALDLSDLSVFKWCFNDGMLDHSLEMIECPGGHVHVSLSRRIPKIDRGSQDDPG